MRSAKAALLGAALFPVACAATAVDASKEQLSNALRACGIRKIDVRPGQPGESTWVWHWHAGPDVNNSSMNCVRDELQSAGLKADFFDASFDHGIS